MRSVALFSLIWMRRFGQRVDASMFSHQITHHLPDPGDDAVRPALRIADPREVVPTRLSGCTMR